MAALRRRLLVAAAGSSHQAPPFSVIDLTSARLPRRPCAEPLCSVSNRPGANVKAVRAMRGHASAAMTLDIYADLFDDDLEAVAVALDAARSREIVAKVWPRAAIDHL
jgi:hypothetical protein